MRQPLAAWIKQHSPDPAVCEVIARWPLGTDDALENMRKKGQSVSKYAEDMEPFGVFA